MKTNAILNALCYVIAMVLVLSACGREKTSSAEPAVRTSNVPAAEDQQKQESDLAPGILHDSLSLRQFSGESYALYLPKAYTHDGTWPILIFFDSHARGRMPLEKYKDLADAFGFILAGSNSSRNGMLPQQSVSIGFHLLHDLREKFSVAQGRYYVSGFSGGARVAVSFAQKDPDIAGVIGSAAGFRPQGSRMFDYVGLVGVEDFNFQEMREVERLLEKTGHDHLFEYFSGGHEWPPLSVMAKAMQWLQLRTMARGELPRQDSVLQNMQEKFEVQDQQLQKAGKDWHRWRLRQKLVSYLKGLKPVTERQNEMATLRQSAAYIEHERIEEDILAREMKMRQEYVAKIPAESISYWTRVTAMLRKIGTSGQAEESWLHMRVLNFLSLATYMQANAALKARDLPEADRLTQIYALVDPPNSEHAYMRAQLAMLQDDRPRAIQSLTQAVSLGFEDKQRLASDPVFAALRGDAGFVSLLQD